MPKSPTKIVVDTNLYISFLISNRLQDFVLALKRFEARLLVSENLIEETFTTAVKPKFRGLITETDLLSLQNTFENFGEIISTTSNFSLCRDPRDNFLLELAADGRADYLITGDKDLLVLKEIKKIPIVKYTEWVTQMKKSE